MTRNDENLKQVHDTGAKREETRLDLVLHLIGGVVGGRFLKPIEKRGCVNENIGSFYMVASWLRHCMEI